MPALSSEASVWLKPARSSVLPEATLKAEAALATCSPLAARRVAPFTFVAPMIVSWRLDNVLRAPPLNVSPPVPLDHAGKTCRPRW